jgi:hypothetical protein
MKKLIQKIKMFFAPMNQEQQLVYETGILAEKLTDRFDEVQNILRKRENILAEQLKLSKDRKQFLQQNGNAQVDQNVERNTDVKRARKLLWWVFGFEAILSYKGTSYLADQFVGLSQWYFIIPIASIFAAFAIGASIKLNHFAQRFRKTNLLKHIFLVIGSYVLVFIIPTCNILEAYESKSTDLVLILNWALVTITILFHSSLITMSKIFIDAENSRAAISLLRQKDNALENIDKKMLKISETFTHAKNSFSNTARQFVSNFKQLQEENTVIAKQMMYKLDNFIIWIINNKVMHHRILSYHANENGQPEVELKYFLPENNSIIQVWDQLSTVTVIQNDINPGNELTDGTNNQRDELTGGETATPGETDELPNSERNSKRKSQHTQSDNIREAQNENDKTVSSYEDAIENNISNNNDKIL